MKQEDRSKGQKKIDSRYRELRAKIRKTGRSSLSTEERKEFLRVERLTFDNRFNE